MNIAELTAQADWTFLVIANDGRVGQFDLRPYLQYEAFEKLNDITEFMKIKNGGYFVEWECGADLSADTIEARMSVASPPTTLNPPILSTQTLPPSAT
jgi:hypothetical protein